MPVPDASSTVETLYVDHHRWLQGWLRKKLGSTFEAADLAHDTFLRILGRGEAQECLREPRAYLVTVAGGLLNNHLRRQALEQAWLDTLAAQPERVAPSPEQHRQVMEALEAVIRMLERMPARAREVFLLSQWECLGYRQIAERLGLTANVVQKDMARALGHCYRVLYLHVD